MDEGGEGERTGGTGLAYGRLRTVQRGRKEWDDAPSGCVPGGVGRGKVRGNRTKKAVWLKWSMMHPLLADSFGKSFDFLVK